MECLTCILFYGALALVVLKLFIKLTTGWCRSNRCLVGKTAIVTGANTGIGYETAEEFAKRGARVILACRDPTRGQNAVDRIIENTDNPNVIYKQLNLASFKSVKEFAKGILKDESRLDILVNNAGAGGIASTKSEDGLLRLMQVNYFGPFLLTHLLLDLLKKTQHSRIINVASIAARFCRKYDVNKLNHYPSETKAADIAIYARSKLCNILFTIELAERLQGTSVTTYSVHPGIVLTELFREMPPFMKFFFQQTVNWFFKSSIEGAQTSIHCSLAKDIETLSGQHFHDCDVVNRYKTASEVDAQKLWTVSEKICKISK